MRISSYGGIHSKIVCTRFVKAMSASLRVMWAIVCASTMAGRSAPGPSLCAAPGGAAQMLFITINRLVQIKQPLDLGARLDDLVTVRQHVDHRLAERAPVPARDDPPHLADRYRHAPAGCVGHDHWRAAQH